MQYYRFKVETKGEDEIRIFGRIASDGQDFKNYNKYLNQYYGTYIEDNEDYIPYKNNNEIIMVLAENLFDVEDLESVFEVMSDALYCRE